MICLCYRCLIATGNADLWFNLNPSDIVPDACSLCGDQTREPVKTDYGFTFAHWNARVIVATNIIELDKEDIPIVLV